MDTTLINLKSWILNDFRDALKDMGFKGSKEEGIEVIMICYYLNFLITL